MEFRAPTSEDQERKARLLERVQADRADLVFQFPFVARLAMHLELVPVVDFRIPTAATDGHRIWLNPDFLLALTDQERQFVVAHEVWHCALGHLDRRVGRDDEERWNVAVDHEVNGMLACEGLVVPSDAVLFRRWRGLPAEEVYELLALPMEPGYEEWDDSDASLPRDLYRAFEPPTPPSLDRGRFADVHAIPESEVSPEDAHSSGPLIVPVDPAFRPTPPPPVEVWEDRLLVAAQQAPDAAHALGDALRRRLDQLRAPTVPWQEVLRQFVTSAYGGERRWLPPNRRYISRGLYLPSRRTERLRLVVAIDTSGSTQPWLQEFASELVGLVQSFGRYELTLICCDEEIRSVREFDDSNPLTSHDLVFDGGWGTDFRPVFEWLEAEGSDADVLVFLTDGEGPAPEVGPRIPVLWALTEGGEAPAGWGQVVWVTK